MSVPFRRPIPLCQHPEDTRDPKHPVLCGLPSVAVWTLEDGRTLFLCEDHDKMLARWADRLWITQ